MPFNFKFDHTPDSSKPHLCETCRFSAVVRGSEGPTYTFCSKFQAPVQLKAVECSVYVDKKSQTLDEMKGTAWLLGTKKIVGLAGGIPHDDVQVTWTKPGDRNDNHV
jgi:hypothetical protein